MAELNGAKVLLVDDDDLGRRGIRTMLEGDEQD